MRSITPVQSLDDPRIALFRNVKDRQVDRAGKFFLAEGEFILRRLLESDFPVESVLLAERRVDEMAPLIPADIPVYSAASAQMHEIVGMKFHSGILACGRRLPPKKLDDVLPAPQLAPRRLTLVALPDIANVENVGALIRIAAGFGADAMLLGQECHDPFWRQSIRVSMGTVFRLPLIQSMDFLRDLRRLKSEWGFERIATVVDPGAESLAEARRADRLVILFGGEAHGLEPGALAECDRRVVIPMKLGTDSLNVAVAAGVCLYHFTR
jgi:tRNA G18 (ribose-2'-O)-methylase SpoU